LRPYSKDHSLKKPAMPSYVVQPVGTEQVKDIVGLANKEHIPLIPCSSRTHLYGTTIPNQGGVVVDLLRMNKIYPVDKANSAVRVEAGVTWGQLLPQLAREDYMTLTPLFPQAERSVVTSLLEREALVDCMYEYGEPLLTLEAVFPNGRVYRSGSASVKGVFEGAASAGVYPEGPGLDLFRLFQGAQGTMGIVTWAVVKTEYRPKVNKMFFASFKNLEDAIQPLYRLERQTIGRECFLLNRVNLAALLAEKWPADYEALARTLPAWTLVVVLSGGRRRPEERVAYEEDALKEIGAEFRIDFATSLPGAAGVERKLMEMLRWPWPDGKPYWKQGMKGSFQDLFFITTLDKVNTFAGIMTALAPRHSYSLDKLGCYLQPLERGRACHLEFNLYHSPEDMEDRERIRRLYGEAAQAMLKEGALYTRPYGELAPMVYGRAAAYATVLKKIKKWLDPNNIMAPGNLCF
ncbi:MAG: FAD-binding oxidoreductase, partial [Dehalococcoidia bacterium]|nr:FAD-binding oxidoreductase [Dehalococcoidia bacterium]